MTLLACDFGASTKVLGVDTSASGSSGDESDTGDSDEIDPEEVDDDEDGYSEAAGDCDDTDDTIHPGATDVCNGVDEDCDDLVDEDAAEDDAYEPNDTVDFPLGEMDSSLDIEVSAFLHDEDDVDRFSFSIDDGFFTSNRVRITLSEIGADFTFKLAVTTLPGGQTVDEKINTVDSEVSITIEDGIFGDDSSEYRVRVSTLGGADCNEPYRLILENLGRFD
jgi:hypothetical protein